jgi:putative ABC transport system substrate-binding protein
VRRGKCRVTSDRWREAELNMKKKVTVLPSAMLFALCVPAQAQQPAGKVPRIGFLHTGSASDPMNSRRLDVFRQSLRDLGYIEGKNITIEYRYGEGKSERLQQLAEELVRFNVDTLVASTATAARSMRKATTTIPIVVVNMGSLTGLVDSLARPGGNVKGLTHISSELLGKRLELLREVVPRLNRIAFLAHGGDPAHTLFVKEAQDAGKSLGVQIQPVVVNGPAEFDGAFLAMTRERAGALVVQPIFNSTEQSRRILDLAARNRLPTISDGSQFAEAGGLMCYGPERLALVRRTAVYVDKILKGAKPADLPVEQPTKFEFVINLRTAKQIGVTIPQSVLFRADRVIK